MLGNPRTPSSNHSITRGCPLKIMTHHSNNLLNTILVGEDDEDIREIISIILTNKGYAVIPARQGSEVQTVLDSQTPNLIIMDVRMPGINGKDITKALKGNEITKHIPVILISAFGHLKDMAKDAGADGYLSKPFNVDDLIALAERFCPTRTAI
jgi:DNA-binding response OmpR family regulator